MGKGKRIRSKSPGKKQPEIVNLVEKTSDNQDEKLKRIEREIKDKEKRKKKLFKRYTKLLRTYEIRLQKWQNRILDKAYKETIVHVLGVKNMSAFYFKPDLGEGETNEQKISFALKKELPGKFYETDYFKSIAKPGWVNLEPLVKIDKTEPEGEMLDLRLPSDRLKLRQQFLKGQEKEDFINELRKAIDKFKQIYSSVQPKKPKLPRGLTQADFERLSSPQAGSSEEDESEEEGEDEEDEED